MKEARYKRKLRLIAARKIGTHSTKEWESLVMEFGGKCVRCQRDDASVGRDHIIPIYQGGGDGIDNIQPLCGRCNSSKGPETTDWKKIRRELEAA